MDRFDLLTARESNGKTYFTKLGVMFENRNGDGFNIVLEALPIPGPDGCRIIAKRPQERDSGQQRQQPRQSRSQFDDQDAPF